MRMCDGQADLPRKPEKATVRLDQRQLMSKSGTSASLIDVMRCNFEKKESIPPSEKGTFLRSRFFAECRDMTAITGRELIQKMRIIPQKHFFSNQQFNQIIQWIKVTRKVADILRP